ncbi:hypothetical protein CcrSwift_gp099 [Caulobacter phage CcrSwift]|uniref:Uncharacterized protein n=1 Tax=Caulobacter phage CcrSwift TaxID=2927984 RepID=K4K746_9CAUD|nr:hypothetical protein D870_gp322 [Caulobacter phage CcrSwift]AFU88417.1 hypothetical protein CcrSwift_gp099 [Caulobacter phage CcrSwift]
MAYIFVDGCDSGSNATNTPMAQKWSWAVTNTSYLNWGGTGRFGGQAYYGGATTLNIYGAGKAFPLTGTAVGTDEFFMGCSLYMAGTASGGYIMAFQNSTPVLDGSVTFSTGSAPTQLSIRLTGSMTLAIYRGATLLATGTTVLTAGQWYRIEARIVISNTGVFDIRLNGNPEITFSGDTYDTGDLGVRQFCIIPTANTSASLRFDDIVLYNSAAVEGEPTTWLGDLRIDTLRPTANGDVVNSTPLSGAAYAAVDEVAIDGDTTYTESTNIGDKDLYQLGDLTETPQTIHAVVVTAVAKSTGTTNRAIKLKVKSSVEGDSAAKTVPLSAYGGLQATFSRDPATTAAWTATAVNGMQAGWQVDT